jgi:hypothetical protein
MRNPSGSRRLVAATARCTVGRTCWERSGLKQARSVTRTGCVAECSGRARWGVRARPSARLRPAPGRLPPQVRGRASSSESWNERRRNLFILNQAIVQDGPKIQRNRYLRVWVSIATFAHDLPGKPSGPTWAGHRTSGRRRGARVAAVRSRAELAPRRAPAFGETLRPTRRCARGREARHLGAPGATTGPRGETLGRARRYDRPARRTLGRAATRSGALRHGTNRGR